MSVFSIEEAAWLLGVNEDTIRRWAEVGQLATTTTASGQSGVDGAELARFAASRSTAPSGGEALLHTSTRNEFPGLVTRVVRGRVVAQVEIQAGPHRVVSLMPVEVVDELKLKPGTHAVASVTPANVVVRPDPLCAW